MKKILYIQSKFGLGGINRITSVKENYLVNHGYDIHNLNAQDEESISASEMYDEKIVMHFISLEKLNKFLLVPVFGRMIRFFYYRWRMLLLIYKINPDVIIVNMPRLEPVSVVWLSFWKKRFLEFHGWYNSPDKISLPWRERAYFFWTSPFYQIVALTKRESEKLKKLTGCSAIYIPNPLYFSPKQLSSCDSLRVISMARFTPEKQLEAFIPYWKKIEEMCLGWELHLYGEGPNESRIRKVIDDNSLRTVYLHPYSKNTKDILLHGSIYILPSLFEGFPLVLMESMAFGVPCVAYDCPFGPSAIINNGEDGFLTAYDNPQAMIDKIMFLIEHEDLRKEMGRKARENIQRFNLDGIMEEWMRLFEE